MPTPQMTTAEALLAALASTIACSAQGLQAAIRAEGVILHSCVQEVDK